MINWKRNLIVLSMVQLATMIGFSGYHPFVAYYMLDLGVANAAEAATWMAAFNSGAAVAMMIASPIWGMLGDRHGRKIMLVRATIAGCVFTFLMGMATDPTQLVILRVIQGMFSGTVVAAITLVATGTLTSIWVAAWGSCRPHSSSVSPLARSWAGPLPTRSAIAMSFSCPQD